MPREWLHLSQSCGLPNSKLYEAGLSRQEGRAVEAAQLQCNAGGAAAHGQLKRPRSSLMPDHQAIFLPSLPACVPCLQVLQTLSILIQNLRNQQTVYYLFSNNHINEIVSMRFDFDDDEVLVGASGWVLVGARWQWVGWGAQVLAVADSAGGRCVGSAL